MPKTNLKREICEPENEITGNGDQPISAVLTRAVERVCSLTSADGAAIALRDPQGVLCQASTGNAPDVGSRLQPDSGLTRECFETGQVVLCEDAENDSRVRPSIARSLHLRSVVAVPIQAQGSVVGVMEVFSSRPSAFATTEVAALQRIADLLAPISAPGPLKGDQPVATGRPLVVAQAEAPSFAEEQPATQRTSIVGPPERLADSTRQTIGVEAGRLSSPAVTPGIFGRVEKRTATLTWLAAAAAVLSLLSLLLLFFANSHRGPTKVPSVATIPPASGPVRSDETVTGSTGAEGASPTSRAGPVEESKTPALKNPSPQPAQPASKTPAVEAHDAGVVRPASPALVIEGAPPGAQIFVDDQLTASTDLEGQAKISTLAPGQHRLRLRLNGYEDYDQGIDLSAGQTSRVVAKLEPFELPILAAPAKPPSLAVTATPPPVVRSTKVANPDFVLDRTLKGHSSWVTAVAFSADGQRLASGSWDQTVKFWDVPSGEKLGSLASKMKEVQTLAFSRDGHWLATENSANTVTLWDATTGREIRTLPGNKPLGVLGSNWVYSIAFSPDGRWLATGVDDKTVRLWDVKTGRAVRDLEAPRRSVIYIAFSPDGRWLASGGDDKTIRIWEVFTGREIRTLSGHKKPIYAVAFSPNGRWLASASADKSVKLWEVATGREVHTLTGHGNVVSSIVFSPDGRWLASGSWDKTIKIWNVESGHEVQTLGGHTHHIYTVAFDSRGRWLASGSEDGTIKLWRLGEAVDQIGLR